MTASDQQSGGVEEAGLTVAVVTGAASGMGAACARLLAGRSALAASLVLGVVWAAWHLPLATVGDLSLLGTLNVLFAAVVFTWLFQRTAGSVLLAILFHAAHQNSVRYLAPVLSGAPG